MPRVAIVMPYFQREAGILLRTLASVQAQTVDDWMLLVVDDASPVPARSEIADLIETDPQRYRLIEQANTGPAGARNRGLDAVPADCEYVAFLDSDDAWSPDHLENALTALAAGHDFYFADHLQLGATTPAFARGGRLRAEQHRPLSAPHLYAFTADLFEQTLTGNVIGTSTVVFRHAKYPAQRFHQNLVFAGEDYLFWMELARAGARPAFSTRCEATYGRGVNVFAGSGWGSEHSLHRLCDEITFWRAIPRLFALTATQRAHVRQRTRILRRSLALDLLHRLLHRKSLHPGRLLRLSRQDPAALLLLLPNLVIGKLRRS